MTEDRKFLFEYRFAGAEWCVTIFAADAAEAREKIKQVALARYKGEVHAEIHVPLGGIISRAWRALIGRQR
jgi:hypothetical protein